MRVVRKMLRLRAVIYVGVGVVCVVFNVLLFNGLLFVGCPTAFANTIAFVLGGQLSFVLHDRKTFRDRHDGREGLRARWMKFMSGNFAALGINATAATILIWLALVPQLINVGAMAISGLFSYTWNNLYSHRDRQTEGDDRDAV